MISTKTLIMVSLLGVMVASGCAVSQSYKEEELGLRKVCLAAEFASNTGNFPVDNERQTQARHEYLEV